MSGMSNLMVDLLEEVEKGELSFAEIAAKYEVPISWVEEAQQLAIEAEA